jgi:hypothetical protein
MQQYKGGQENPGSRLRQVNGLGAGAQVDTGPGLPVGDTSVLVDELFFAQSLRTFFFLVPSSTLRDFALLPLALVLLRLLWMPCRIP